MKPYRVILERDINRKVVVPLDRTRVRGPNPKDETTVWLSGCLEAKWIKRFRRTIVNQNKTGEIGAYRALVNPTRMPWENDSDAPAEPPSRGHHRRWSREGL